MNPETTITKQQIRSIFKHHSLSQNPEINRITIGFSNEIHRVDDYILKIYVHKDEEGSFDKESKFYRELYGKVLVPRLLVADKSREIIKKPYIIYEMIPGQSLGNCWHLLNDEQRRGIIKVVCEQLKIIMANYPDGILDKAESWQDYIVGRLEEKLATDKIIRIISNQTKSLINQYIAKNRHVLEPARLEYTYWDLHQDNIIVDNGGRVTGLIDFEHIDVVSVDYLLNTVRRMVLDPARNVSVEMEKYAKVEDYAHVMDWFREFLPEAFNFSHLETRLDFYELDEDLRILPDFPKAKTLHDSIARIVG